MLGDISVVKLLKYSNFSLLVCLLGVVVTVLLAYPMADMLTLPAQIAAHIGTVIFAALLKVSYVTRLVSLRNLGRPVH